MKFPLLAFTIGLLLLDVLHAQAAPERKLYATILPFLELNEAPLSDAIEYLHQKSIELDPASNGVNLLIMDQELRDKPVTFALNHVRMADAVHYAVSLAGGVVSYNDHAVLIGSGKLGALPKAPKGKTAYIEAKLRKLIIPSVQFSEVPVTDALEFLVVKSQEIDKSKIRGINIIYAGDRDAINEPKVTLRLSNIPAGELLKYIANLSGHRFRVEPAAIYVY